MTEDSINILIILSGGVGASIGAYIGKSPPWRGAISFVGGIMVGSAASYLFQIDPIVLIILSIIAIAAIGSSLKINPNSILLLIVFGFIGGCAAFSIFGAALS